jgi:hypothetical protein
MESIMSDVVTPFIDNNYTEEVASELFRAFGLMEVLGQNEFKQAIDNVVMQEQDEHREVIMDQVVQLVDQGLNALFMAMRVTVNDSASMKMKNDILQAVYSYAFLEDYLPYMRVLENDFLNAEQKFAEILEDITNVPKEEYLMVLDFVYEGAIERLKEFTAPKVQEEEEFTDPELLKKIRKGLRIYRSAFGEPAATNRLAEIDMQKGLKFDVYLQLFESEVVDRSDLESTTFNLLWLTLISEDGVNNAQSLLLETGKRIFTDFTELQKFQSMTQKAIGRMEELKMKEQNEQA